LLFSCVYGAGLIRPPHPRHLTGAENRGQHAGPPKTVVCSKVAYGGFSVRGGECPQLVGLAMKIKRDHSIN